MATMTSIVLLLLASPLCATIVRSPAPPMGWNSYNSYSCNPSEAIIKLNAEGLISTGLKDLGYTLVTPDCGWQNQSRDAQQQMQWNATLFPSGGEALGKYLHGLGLRFGLYSGGGYHQCGSYDLPGSLGYEEIDAKTFAAWGGDSLKYDNCFSTSNDTMVDNDSEEAQSPARFEKMAASLDAQSRDFQFFICQWGIGENVGDWASQIGNTWRMSNDIYNAWRSIWRISNQVVPYYRNTRPGAFPDMDMLIVGLDALSAEEERFHYSMWAINKSPLLIGAKLDSTLPAASLKTLSNQDVISINQDPLSKQARLVKRYTEEEWDVWLGELSENRQVLGIANWRNESQSVELDLRSIGIGEANAKDVWAAESLGSLQRNLTIDLTAHEMKLLLLTNITAPQVPFESTGYYPASNASLSGSATLSTCPNGTCHPTGLKAADIGQDASITFRSIKAKSSGSKLLGVDFINYDYATTTAWDWGSNTRNLSVEVNGGQSKRWAFPLSGENWYETGRLSIEADGFVAGASNEVVFRAVGNSSAPDIVGFEVFE
ncbi:carbohydrate-binding module family 35 protein [Lophiostoma macrostomum CBS 122681]|uniref:Alpha-galactosidase n=1 Tax=Lophiostoma macrostomum CBS 122681 TaxID=1314788 RepID=A0A6A6TQB3_9PLEO|nr:carbohydrate-binding module family 35 protein [Lophiostoma macrostomum CBS 122681]